MGESENGRARGRHARGEGAPSPLACLLLARPFFLVPTTSKRLLRKLQLLQTTREGINDRALKCKGGTGDFFLRLGLPSTRIR